MTLDEAIERYTSNAEYERTHGNLQGYLDFRQLAEWLKDYKRLLEHESCEDCISRQYLLDNCVVDNVTFPYVPINRIQEAPPVNPQQKMGKWIKKEIHDGCITTYRNVCSNCGITNASIYKNYCPNCGAKMQESEE